VVIFDAIRSLFIGVQGTAVRGYIRHGLSRLRQRGPGQALKSPHRVGLFCPYSRSLLTLV
jgi:hypothetical protein